MKCSDKDVDETFGLGYLPRLVYFEHGVPDPFVGDLGNEGEILRWIAGELRQDEIKSVTRSILEKLTQKMEHVGVIFVDAEDKQETELLHELEQAHDELLERELTLVQVLNLQHLHDSVFHWHFV